MTAHPFLVPVAQLRRRIGNRQHEQRQGLISDLACSGSAVPEHVPVEVDVVLESVFGGVDVYGTVRTTWVGSCRRCLEEATGLLEVPVRELYTEGGDGEETYPLVDDMVDLEVLAHDAVLLELPQVPLCRPDCRGLCPHCGINRNVATCSCTEPGDPRWAALEALRSDT